MVAGMGIMCDLSNGDFHFYNVRKSVSITQRKILPSILWGYRDSEFQFCAGWLYPDRCNYELVIIFGDQV